MLPPRDTEGVKHLIEQMEGYYAHMFTQFDEDDAYYEGDAEGMGIEFPKAFAETISTTARSVIDEAVDNIEPHDLMVTYAPRQFGKTPQEDAESISRFLKNMWLYWRRANSDIDPLRDFMKNLFKNGKAVWKVIPDWTLWPSLEDDVEEKLMKKGGTGAVKERVKLIKKVRENNFPIILRSIPPKHIMEDPTVNGRKLWCVERYRLGLEEVENRYSEWDPTLGDPDETGDYEIHEFWSATYIDWNGNLRKGKHMVFISGNEVVTEENIFHELPYVIKYSGFGRETFEGKPHYKATGFFNKPVRSQIKAEIRRLTHFDAIMSQLAFPTAFLPESARDFDFDVAPGAINYIPEHIWEDLGKIFVQMQIPAPEYQQSLSMIQNQIERATTQRAIRGAGVPGTDSAAQLQMITSQAKLRLEPVKITTEEACDLVNGLVLRYVEDVFESTVSVFGAERLGPERYTLKPNQIKGKHTTRTFFQPSDDQVKERKLMLMAEATSKAGMNKYDAYVLAGFENAMEMVNRDLAYLIMFEDDNVRRALGKQAAREWGLDVDEIELNEMMEQAEAQTMLSRYAQMLQAGSVPGSGTPEDTSIPPEGAPMPQGPVAELNQGLGAPLGAEGGGRPPEMEGPMPPDMGDIL